MNYSEVESRRFGLDIYRGYIDSVDEKELLKDLITADVDIAILRLPVEKSTEIHRLGHTGIPYLIADTHVYYQVNLQKLVPPLPKNADLEFLEAMESDSGTLNQLVEAIFPHYKNHYSSNPYFDRTHILEGYKEWARNYLSGEGSNKKVWLVKRDMQTIGFAIFSFDNAEECECVLHGVLPEHSGVGVYGDILRFAQSYFKREGFARMITKTQIQNFVVQKAWSREGFSLYKAYYTIHINALLKASAGDRHVVPVTITEELVERYGEPGEELTPVHPQKEAAGQAGLADRVAHGLIPTGEVSRHLGMAYPGFNTLLQGCMFRLFSPLHVGRTYHFHYSTPMIPRQGGFYKAVVKVLDEDNNVCILGYLDLFKKTPA